MRLIGSAHLVLLLLLLLLLLLTVRSSLAATLYDEASDGDLSGNKAAPTLLSFSLGSNIVAGEVTSSPLDQDFLTFVVDPGYTLEAITLQSLTPVGNLSFAALELGTQISSTFSQSSLLGYALTGTTPGEDLLELTNGKLFPAASLGPGTYTFWFQETAETVQYSFDFEMVPEPSAGSMGLALVVLIGILRRRR